jgi:hypothetical protein
LTRTLVTDLERRARGIESVNEHSLARSN